MSTLHEKLLARIERSDPHGLIGAWKAVRAVVERHKPVPCRMKACVGNGHALCEACGFRTYEECPDTMAIASALGVEVGDE